MSHFFIAFCITPSDIAHYLEPDLRVDPLPSRPIKNPVATENTAHCEQELQLHLGVLQQHAALIGGPNATSCPVCHKLFLGTEALVDHMKHVHKEKSPPPSGSGKKMATDISK